MLTRVEKSTLNKIADHLLAVHFDGFFYKEIYVRGKAALPNTNTNEIFNWACDWAGMTPVHMS